MPKVFLASKEFSAMFACVTKKSDVGRPSVDIDRRAKGVKFHPVGPSAAGRTGLPGIDSLLFLAGMVARRWKENKMRPHHSDRGHLARNKIAQ